MDSKQIFLLDIFSNLEKFLEKAAPISSIGENKHNQLVILKELIAKQAWTNDDKEEVLQTLSRLLVVTELSSHFKNFLSCVIPELLFRFLETVKAEDEWDSLTALKVLQFYISKRSEILELTSMFIQWLSGKINYHEENEELMILYFKLVFHICDKTTATLETFCTSQFLLQFQEAPNNQLRLYANKLLALSLNIADRDSFSATSEDETEANVLQKYTPVPFVESEECTSSNKSFHKSNFRGRFIPIFNMLFKVQGGTLERQDNVFKHQLVLTDTTMKNLKSLVLGFSTKSIVLVSGDIGCGKTSLIEYFAQCLGRTAPPLMLKLQLGDQIESKSLLGTYVCSDTPGEFVWQPGTLTKAMQLGSWVLLEDVDQAPTDVISMLMALSKTKTLLIPGHSKEIKAADGFQLFVTRRNTVWKNENSILGLFMKQCHQVYMEYPIKNELIEILKEKFENLSPIAKKIVDMFCLVSGNKNLEAEEDVQITSIARRKNTPRDLFKLCERLDTISDSTNRSISNITNETVFHHAVQCFYSSHSSNDGGESVAYAIGAKLGLSKQKVAYYLEKYKPDVKLNENSFTIGHTTLVKNKQNGAINPNPRWFAYTRHSLCLLEKLSVCISNSEPVLLVGDTGCGKTSAVQYLAEQCNSKLDVINMSQQTDSADLFGGFKPVDIREKVKPVKDSFVQLFRDTYSQKENAKFLAHVSKCFVHKRWSILIKLMMHCCVKAGKRTKPLTEDVMVFEELKRRWKEMEDTVKTLETKVISQEGLVFTFIEGALVRSLKLGNWILLDEINLATPESLEYLSGLLDFKSGSVVLSERGDIQEVERHENFRVFACMNPATDVGKKDLPYGIRNRFTELYVEEMDDEGDLKTLVSCYLKNTTLNSAVIDGIIRFYLLIRQQAKEKLVDGSGHRPLYSLRTLCRGLEYAVKQVNMPPIKAIYEGISMSFLTQLDKGSRQIVEKLIYKHILESVKNVKALLSKSNHYKPKDSVNVEGYWINIGSTKPVKDESYVMTNSVKANLMNLARVVAGRYPVLLQGETSVGKTSLITFLAKLTGNECVRVNNHEHTDIQEYIGCYGPDDNGSLVFKEGVLVTAMRYGHWMILDELNLAPSDVLEALNRVLDDNRELFIPETQEVVKAHPKFILFATQNPPGHYGGRKVLSRAFRNRFVELHLDQIPSNELEEILHQRCELPQSYCKKFVKVMLDLQVRRRNGGIFEGKHGFMTLRDLFRWAERYHMSSAGQEGFYDWEQCMCEDGFMLIAGRCRRDDETKVIKEVLEMNFKRSIDLEKLYNGDGLSSQGVLQKVMSILSEEFGHIVWTFTMKRLAVLVGRALQFNEAVLLVGETGCGKTTICQLFAAVRDAKLYSVNCHMHTEAADFLGGLRPVRTKDETENNTRLFEWKDGPLITSMEEGQVFLIDEISLADDSVLERMNSVLEPERTLVLSEKGDTAKLPGNVEVVKASETFCLLATMNPGGDYGKKELSPALRNRFTEIWCSPSESKEDLKKIIEHNIRPGIKLKNFQTTSESGIGSLIIQFLDWFKGTEVGFRFTISIRDLLSWVMFINATVENNNNAINNDVAMEEELNADDEDSSGGEKRITAEEGYVHGACLVFIDAIGSGNTAFGGNRLAEVVKKECITFLSAQVGSQGFAITKSLYTNTVAKFGIHPFLIEKGTTEFLGSGEKYNFDCKTTRKNVVHVLRGLQLHRPILLEGSPGVGKTSLVIALAKMAGHPITRINLSEETDISDLFGADLPGEGSDAGQFLWRDGPFLRALKSGHWVVFDELNLASQSVLEGLNACFDHRAEIYIPELSKTFSVEKNTRIFACQNPLHEGGGRKGLPKSFLNRFTKVYIDALTADDLCQIIQSIFPEQDTRIIESMVAYNHKVNCGVVGGDWGRKGGPWQFNIRDMTRWCQLVQKHQDYNVGDFIRLLYQARMRSIPDRKKITSTYGDVFTDEDLTLRQKTQQCMFRVTPDYIKVGYSCLRRCRLSMGDNSEYQLLRSQLPYVESIMKCVEMNWMALLVGSESCGKNTLVKMLSTLTGNELQTMCCNSSTDSTDLIGSFEQLNKSSQLLDICKELKTLINVYLPSLIDRNGAMRVDVQNLLSVRAKLERFLSGELGQSNEETLEIKTAIQSSLEHFRTSEKDKNIEGAIEKLEMLVRKFQSKRDKPGGQFEWVDGILVTALKKGHWLLLKNANLCSASILDRLNGLLEPGGVLCLDERGVINDDIVTVQPHLNFRLFLSVDPKFGEISRAMRNRGVEIYFLSEDDGYTPDDLDMNLLIKNQNVLGDVSNILRIVHQSFKVKYESQVTWPVLLQCCKITARLIESSYDELSAVQNAVVDTYGPYIKDEPGEDIDVLLKQLVSDAIATVKQNAGVSNNSVASMLPSVVEWSQKSCSSWRQRNLIPLLTDLCAADDDIKALASILYIERSQLPKLSSELQYLYAHLNNIELSAAIQKVFDFVIKVNVVGGESTQDDNNTLAELLSRNCFEVGELSQPHRFILLLILFLRGIRPDTVGLPLKKGSLMCLSQQFVNRKLKLSGLPHISVSYLYNLLNTLFVELFEKWILNVNITTIEDFAKISNAFEWLCYFTNHVMEPLPISISGDLGFSLSQFALHWKWFSERFLNSLTQTLSLGACESMVSEVNNTLGEDHRHFLYYKMVSLFCKPLTLKSSQQSQLLTELRVLYETAHSKENRVMLKEEILKVLGRVILEKDATLCQLIVHRTKTDVQKAPSSNTDRVLNDYLPFIYQSFQNNSLHALISNPVEHALQKKIASDSFDETFGVFVDHIGQIDCISNLFILRQCVVNKDYSPVEKMLPHLKLSLLSSRYRDIVAAMVSEERKMEKVTMPVSLPLFLMVQKMSRQETTRTTLHIPLNEMEYSQEKLHQLISFLWTADCDLFASLDYHVNIVEDAYKTLMSLLQVFCTALERSDLLLSLQNVTEQTTPSNILNKASRYLCTLFKKTREELDLPKTLTQVFIELEQLLSEDHSDNAKPYAGILQCYTSLVQLNMVTPYLKYDPIEEMTCRKEYLQQQLSLIDKELQFRYKVENIWTSATPIQLCVDSVQLEHFTSNAFMVKVLLNRREMLIAEISRIQNQEVVRPEQSEYDILWQDFKYFGETIGNVNTTMSLVQNARKLVTCEDGSDIKEMKLIIHKINAWVNSTNQFVVKLGRYTFYQDVTIPPILAIKSFQNGLLVLAEVLEEKIQTKLFTSYLDASQKSIHHPKLLIHELSNAVCRQPIVTLHNLTDPMMIQCSRYLAKRYPDELTDILPTLLMIALVSLRRHFSTNKNLISGLPAERKTAFSYLTQILEQFYHLWCEKKEYDREQEAKNASMFKYKSKSHCETIAPDEELENMEKSLFPSFENAFEDESTSSLPDVVAAAQRKERTELTTTSGNVSIIDETVIFATIRSIYLDCPHPMCWDVNDVLNRAFELLSRLMSVHDMLQVFPKDESCFPVLFLVLSKVTNSFSEKTTIQPETFNIYEESNVQEATEAKTILARLRCTVVGLLIQFEDQPALLQILKLTDRLLSFGVAIPLMKLVAGFEFLLKQAQDWETYAASHVSLKNHLEEVVGKVIHWRRLELKTWSSLLKNTEVKHADGTAKWFFHFVNLLQEIGSDNDVDEGELVSALKELFENATVGDFNARLDLVQTLYAHIKENGFSERLENVTLNILKYYKQFQTTIEQHKEHGKKPIHKELLDYIKIAKWNDSNYYSIKLAAEKSHRTLTKFVYKFKSHLNEPITQFLQDPKVVTKPVSSVVKKFQYTSSGTKPRAVIIKNEESNVYPIEGFPDLYLSKSSSVSRKMKRHIEKIMMNKRYGEFVEGLDIFAGDIIEALNDLRNRNLDNIPKEKHKEARNNMQQVKRKNLASLLKQLKELGLSFHKADVLQSEIDILRLPTPISTKCVSSEVSEEIETCNYYYFQSIARHAVFEDAMCNPSKEIGPNAISQFKGLTSHLLHIACKQRSTLDTLLSGHSNIKFFLSGLENIRSCLKDKKTVPFQTVTKSWLVQAHEMLGDAFSTLNFVKEILQCAPSLKNMVQTISMDTERPTNNKEDETIRAIVGDVEATIQRIKVVCDASIMQEFKEWDFPIYNWSHWQHVEECIQEIKSVVKTAEDVICFCASRKNNLLCPDKSPLTQPLVELKVRLSKSLQDFNDVDIDEDCSVIETGAKENTDLHVVSFEKLIKKMLISIQKIANVEDTFSHVKTEAEMEEALIKGQISPLLTTTYTAHLSLLDVQAISSLCINCVEKIQTISGNSVTEMCSHYLNLIPIVQEYVELSNYYLFHTVMLHRTTCKLLCIIYQLFTTLLKEGFCKPPEESDCATEEGATEFEDIHDGGLGEGSGAKDVSDQIESEDQVEDTLHEKQQDDNKGNDDTEEQSIKQEKEGIEMTDDFEANLEDMELSDDEDDSKKDDDKEEDETEDIDKQMGDVDEDNELDKNMWDEEEDEDGEKDDEGEEQSNEKDTTDDQQGQTDAKEWKSEQGWSAKDEDLEGQEGSDDKDEPQPDADDDQPSKEETDDDKIDGDDDDEVQQKDSNKTEDATEQPNEEDDEQIDDNLDMGEMSDDQEDTMDDEKATEDQEHNDDDGDDGEEQNEQQGELANEVQSNEIEEEIGGEDEDEDESTLQEANSLKENIPTEGIEATTATGGGHQNSSNQDQQKENAGSEEQSERVNDNNEEGEFGRVTDTKVSSEKPKGQKRKEFQKSSNERTLETQEYPKEAKKRRALEAENQETQDKEENEQQNSSDTYQHISNKEDNSSYDELSVDVISKEQLKEMENVPGVNINKDNNMSDEDEEGKGGEMEVDTDNEHVDSKTANSQGQVETSSDQLIDEQKENEDMETEDSAVQLQPTNEDETIKSDFFTNSQQLILQNFNLKERDAYIQSLRKELEDRLTELPSVASRKDDPGRFDYVGMWMKYDQLTSSLSMQLCEQLRLVIEPTQASKLKGDYRTGKRLNMRKIIPYIASQFQKDKIWLRRTKKSKRNYQIVLAVDDSSSMMDNHLKQLAFESIVVISNGLKLLEAGDLAVISFGEDSRLVHSFQENFNEEAGASILQQFTFEQKKTRVAHLLKYCTLLFDRNRRSSSGNAPISQLLLIVSDGRGIYVEGKESVSRAVSQAREMGIFIVFIILDDPKCQNSILDIKVPVFKPGGGMPEIKSYIEEFPFPFYLLLREINSLPYVLSDALKQWFELVTQPT